MKTLTTIVPSASDRPVKRKIIFKKRVLLQSQCDLVLITFKTPFIFLLAHMAWWTCCTIPIKSEIFPNDIRTGENYFWKREMRNGKIVIQKQTTICHKMLKLLTFCLRLSAAPESVK